ncbi:hypothetical protein WA026_011469 [Henosepilachna vigintioctopunctata]|uniref:Uncharacterized protein n=1 Tax=Henosepilachna vigintioctopunctata TaxID=420089 RepID=A0AAW1TRV4_9CUCU
MMKVFPLLVVTFCTIHQSISQGYWAKPPLRGPPRPPPHPPFVKKWHQLQMTHLRGPTSHSRPRPIPVHYNTQKLKKHYPPNINLNRLVQQMPSVRPFWNSPTTFRPPTEAPLFTKSTEKYSFIPPKHKPKPQNTKDYDFHIQTNQIPVGISSTLHNPIQQVGEKGPIHTIPAPNLSPSDKPLNIEHVRPQVNVQQYHYQPELFRHEYQVTEANEQAKHSNYEHDLASLHQNLDQSGPRLTSEVRFNSQNSDKAAEYYQVVQPSLETEDIPHDQFLKELPNFQLLISEDTQKQPQGSSNQQQPLLVPEISQQIQQPNQYQQPLFVADQSFVQKFQQMQNQDFSKQFTLNPEFHSFNYNEQDYQKQNSKSSLVSAGYNLDIEPEGSEIVHQAIARTPEDSLAQSQYVQRFFETNNDNAGSNNIATDVSSIGQPRPQEGNEEESPEAFYSSLPNKEVADTLASLQAAGRINSNLMQLSNRGSNRQEPIEIFVSESTDPVKPSEDQYEGTRGEFQDYGSSDNNEEEENAEIMNTSFGEKIKPQRT